MQPSGSEVAESSSVAVGVDVGGTKIAAGLITADGTVLEQVRRPSPANDADKIIDVVVEVAHELCAGRSPDLLPVGVGAAGIVNTEGTIVYAPNLEWSQYPVGERLRERLGVSIAVANDGNVAAWGEFRAGAARDVQGSAVMLTLGTGVGGGLVVNDQLALGSHGMGAEFGHIIIAEGGAQCPCGNKGCLEAYASGTAIGKFARKRLADGKVRTTSALHEASEVTGETVTMAAQAGDQEAIDILVTCGTWLGVGIATLVNALDPAMVIIGGGAMEAGDLLLDPARQACAERLLGGDYRAEIPIVRAVLGGDAGMIGAGLLVLEDVPARATPASAAVTAVTRGTRGAAPPGTT